MDKLKPCPFCGNTEIDDFTPDDEWGGHVVMCGKCESEGPPMKSHKEAIDAWNTRG